MIDLIPSSDQERVLVDALWKGGVLVKMSEEHFTRKNNVIAVYCCDGRQVIRGILVPFMEMYDEKHELAFHAITRHGGTLLLDKNSPLILPGHTTAEDLIIDIRFAVDMGYKDICLINHFPCGMMRKHNMNPIQGIVSLFKAKKRIKYKEKMEVSVACFLQVSDGDKRTIYHFRSSLFPRWRRNNPQYFL